MSTDGTDLLEEGGVVTGPAGDGYVWVETQRQGACGSCSVSHGCGSGALARFFSRRHLVRARDPVGVEAGEQVVLGLRSEALLRGAFMVYALPLVTLFGGGLFAELMRSRLGGEGELAILLGAISGLLLGLWAARRYAAGPAARGLHPVILRRTAESPLVWGARRPLAD